MKPLMIDNSKYIILGPVDQLWLALTLHQRFKTEKVWPSDQMLLGAKLRGTFDSFVN